MADLRAIDLCAGAGGWAAAARGLPIQVLLAVDVWKPALMTYQINHPDTGVIAWDCSRLAELWPPDQCRGQVDLVLGGIPCQWISVYRGKGLRNEPSEQEVEKQRSLLDSILDWIRLVDPPYYCLEDVRGLIKEIPPLTPYQVIDSAEFSGQRRKRVYVGRFPSPPPQANGQVLGDYLRPGPYRVGPRLWPRELTTSRSFSRSNALKADPERKAPTVVAITSRRDAEIGIVADHLPGGKRQYEWQEAARLQGFPEDYLFWGSPTDVGQMIGNAVQIDTGRAILKAICSQAHERFELTAEGPRMTHFLVSITTRTPDGDAQAEDTLEIEAYCEEDAIIHVLQSRKSRRIQTTHRGTVPDRLAGVNVVRWRTADGRDDR